MEDTSIETKVCACCGVEKPVTLFFKSGNGYRKKCKRCHINDVSKRQKAKQPYFSNAKRLLKIVGPKIGTKKAKTMINVESIKELLQDRKIDPSNYKKVLVFPPNDTSGYENFELYQIITY